MTGMNRNWRERMENLKDFNKFLFNNEFMSDVTFVFDREGMATKKIFAHSWILATISVVFYDLMKETFETCKMIPVVDYEYDDFLAFLQHFYDNDCTVDEKRYDSIKSLCEKCSVPFIERKYLKLLYDMPTTEDETTFNRLELALNINSEEEVNRTVNFIALITMQFFNLPRFIHISSNALRCILSVEKVRDALSEVDLFTAVMRWAAQRCKENEWTITGVNKRRSLDDLIKLIKFPLMSADEFSSCVINEENLLLPEETTAILLQILRGKINGFKFNISPRLEYFEIFFQSLTSNERPQSIRSTFTCNKTIGVDVLIIAAPMTATQKVTAKFYNENEELLFDDVHMIQFTTTQLFQFFPLKRSVIIESDLKYSIDLHYENTSDVFRYKKRSTFKISNRDAICNFTEIGDTFDGIVCFMVM